MNKKHNLFIFFTFILFIIFIILNCRPVFSAYPKLVTKLVNGFETIKNWIIKISTPAAAVAVRNWSFYEEI